MKSNKLILISIVLLAILSLGAVSAHDNATDDVSSTAQDDSIQLNSNDNSKLGDDASATYNKQIYVNTTGSDSGAGSEASPYATINKAIGDVNASDNAIIYLGSGTYSDEGNTNLKINLAHKNYGGSLTLMGASDGTTKIDGNEISPIIATISADSVVILKNIVFTHGKNNLGSAITSAGNLTVDSCVFENNYATTLGALYFNGANDFNVINTTFRNNYGGNGYADMYYSYSGAYTANVIDCKFIGSKSGNTNMPSFSIQNSVIYIVGNTFENMTGGSTSGTFQVSYGNAPKYVINNTFFNCNFTGTGAGGIFATQNSYLENNIFVNCTTNSAQIYAQTEFNARIKFLNATVDGTTFKLYANVSDDVGNLVTAGGSVYFFIDGVQVGTGTVTKGVASVSVSKLLENGNYTLSGDYKYSTNPFEVSVENGTLTVDFNHNPLEIWVSPDGNDTNGTGSEDSPFLTLKHALDYGFSNTVDLTIHVKDGVYNGSANRGLSYSPVGKLTIIGESYGNAIIDAEKAAATIFTFGQNLDVKLANLTLVNTTGRVINVYNLELVDSIIKNVGSFYAQYSNANIVFNNLTYENSGALQMYNPVIYNSAFINNNGGTATGLIWAASNGDKIVDIQNTTFTNNKIEGYSGGAALYIQGNAVLINNRYERNVVSGSNAKFIVYCNGNRIVSINETFVGNDATSYVGQYSSTGTDPTLYIENIIFENNKASGDGAGLVLNGGLVNGAKFINNTAEKNGGAIYLLYHSSSMNVENLVLNNVVFENNTASRGSDIFIQEPTSTSYAAGVLENITITAENLSTDLLADTLTVTLTHESGAKIGGGQITFYLDGNNIGTSTVDNGEATFEYLGFKNGTYNFTETYSLNATSYKHVDGIITVALKPLLDNITLYVSDSRGNDENGNGSADNPFKTIQTALSAGYAQSPVVIVNVLEGTYVGDKNVNLNIPTGLDITINGAGADKTIICDTTADYFFKALAGDGSLTVSNLTVNRSSKRLNSMIYIVEGASVTLDNVVITRGIGNDGGAIYSEGTLTINNSYFYNNGLGETSFSSRAGGAIYNKGILLIYNSIFYANHASGAAGGLGGAVIYNTGDLEIYSSILNDSVCDYGMNMAYMAIQGTATSTIKMFDTIVTITGRTAAEIVPDDLYNLNGRAVPTIGIGQAGTGIFVNCTFDGANVLNHAGSVVFGNINNWNPVMIRNITVINSTFKDLKAPTVVYGANVANTPESYRVFDGCLFDNVQFLYVVLVNTNKVHITINNSVILPNGTQMIGTTANPIQVQTDINNNWWGSNSGVYDLTTVTRTAGSANAFYNINPNVRTTTNLENYLVLTATKGENDITLEFKVFENDTYSEYAGTLMDRLFTITVVNGTAGVSNGTINKKVVIPFEATDLRYAINITVDNETISMVYDERNETVLDVIGIDKDLGIITVLTDINGTPIANANIDYAIGEFTGNLTSDENGTVVIPCLANGELTINFAETSELLGSNKTFIIDGVVKSDVPLIITIPEEIEIGDDVAIIVSIENATGNVTLYVDGVANELELENGIANYVLEAISQGNHTIFAIYTGNDLIAAVENITTINNIAKKEAKAEIETDNMEIGETGTITVTIPDATGSVKIIFDGESNIIDLEDGVATYDVEKVTAGNHSIVVIYDGDNIYAATNEIKQFTVAKKDTSISVIAPETSVIGKSTTISVDIDESATGIVIITIGDENIAISLDDAKSVDFTFDKEGSFNIYATYLGDDSFNGNISQTVTINVAGKKQSVIDISVPENIKAGSDVNIVISIENATGKATIIVDGKETSKDLENGNATYTIVAVKAGEHSITVIYDGDEYYTASFNTKSFIAEKQTTTANITLPTDYKVGEKANVTISVPGITGNITVIVDSSEIIATLNEKGIAVVPIETEAGEHSIVVIYPGDETYNAFYKSASMNVEVLYTTFTNITVSGVTVSAILVNALGDGMANATIFYTIDDVKYNTTTDDKGAFTVQGIVDKSVKIDYEGDGAFLPSGISVDLKDTTPVKSDVYFEVEKKSITTYTVETAAGEKGAKWFVATLKDNNGVLANANVQFTFNGKVYNLTTNSKGQAKFQLNLGVSQKYTGTFVYLGDETHNSNYAVVTAKVNKKTVKISAKSKTFKAKTKTKKYTVTLKTIVGSSADKKAHLKSGKVVYLKVKGKTYKAKINAKGKATFKITKLNKKGKYTAKITFKATNIYKGATKKVKIKVK